MSEIVLVVSGYAADLSWLERVLVPWVVYHKGRSPSHQAIVLPNVGRESHTYLYHICKNYDVLPKWTIFSQDDPFSHTHGFVERINSLVDLSMSSGFLNLCDRIATDDGDGNPHFPGARLREHYRSLFRMEKDEFTFGAGAQFAVGSEAIRSRSLAFYERLMDFVVTEPKGPWVLERFWPYVFGSEGAK